jgi:hypothetical protein
MISQTLIKQANLPLLFRKLLELEKPSIDRSKKSSDSGSL